MLDEKLMGALFEDMLRRSNAVGAQLSIIEGDQQLDFAGGYANADRQLPMTADTLMQIGSITKLFNAILVVSLADEGVLDLHAPVQSITPMVPLPAHRASERLTLARLLSMSSGLDNGPYAYYGGGEDALGQYVAHLKALPQHFLPGEHFGYSNAGTCIAGYIASHVTGKSWETLIRERILKPAGLTRAALLEADVLYQPMSAGHVLSPGGALEVIDPVLTMARARAPSGASLALSTGDLARFARVFLQSGVADTGARIASDRCIEWMMSARTAVPTRKYGTQWCMGPYTGDWNEVRIWGHGGTSPTSSSFLHWIPDRQGVIAFTVNTHSAMGEFSRIAFDEVTKIAFGTSKPRFDLPAEDPPPTDHRRYVGTYAELGATMEVARGDDDMLEIHICPRASAHRSEQRAVLIPLGEDRFLVSPRDGPDKHRGIVDMAFFGDDGQGRATNALNLVFPMSRVAS